MARTAAVFFDVDFTLIHPGPTLPGRRAIRPTAPGTGSPSIPARFDAAVAGGLGRARRRRPGYDAGLYVTYTRRIIELMGGTGPASTTVAREIYDQWAEHKHFSLYDDVAGHADGAARAEVSSSGLISNSHRCLASFQSHFELDGLISVDRVVVGTRLHEAASEDLSPRRSI